MELSRVLSQLVGWRGTYVGVDHVVVVVVVLYVRDRMEGENVGERVEDESPLFLRLETSDYLEGGGKTLYLFVVSVVEEAAGLLLKFSAEVTGKGVEGEK